MALPRPLIRERSKLLRTEQLIWPPLTVGHRGSAGDAPENTLAAFDLAARQGADGIEFDVHLSADGVPVVIHDAQLERTTGASGRVGDYSLAYLKRLEAGSWFNRKFPRRARARYRGQKIPELAEVLAWVRARQLRAYVEIKLGGRIYPGIEERVLDAIARANVAALTTVISFHLPTLRRLRRLDSQVALGIDFGRPILAARRAQMIGSSCVLPHWALAPRRFILRAHQAGLQVLVWDLDDPRWMRRKIFDGVDGIVTRFPARMKTVLAEIKDIWTEAPAWRSRPGRRFDHPFGIRGGRGSRL